jgi:hypothetical protein
MQAQRLQTVPAPPGAPNGGTGTVVVFTNTEIGYQGLDTSPPFGNATRPLPGIFDGFVNSLSKWS